MDSKTNIEIEFRAHFDEKKYKELQDFLNKNAEDLGQDNKNVFFFIFPNKLLKIVNNVSKKTAKIVLKLNKIGQGSDFEEIEVAINPEDVNKLVKIFLSFGFTEIIESFQKRRNYQYKGVELSLKYSENWGYHLELEILINNLRQKQTAETKIQKIADELKVKLMTDQELTAFTKQAEQEYQNKTSKKLKI